MKNVIEQEQTEDRATSRRAAHGQAESMEQMCAPRVTARAATGDRSRSGSKQMKNLIEQKQTEETETGKEISVVSVTSGSSPKTICPPLTV
jgi:hypothetical protein